jgi:flavin-dependent dehydrogenase
MKDTCDAIVIGGSVAGLLVARALSSSAERVLVLDRDALPDAPEVRRCVGQGAQVHLLLDTGREAIEALLPGVFDEIEADGGLRINLGEAVSWYHAGHFKVRTPTAYDTPVQTRPLLEHHLRRRVAALDGITLRGGSQVSGLRVEGGAVRGVTLATDRGEAHIDAPIVIEASGRGSQAPRWLEAAGFSPPPATEVAIGLGYASRMYRKPRHASKDARLYLTYGTRSRTTRHGLLFEVEGDRWLVTLMGYHGDHPPTDADGFEAWLRTLEHPQLASVLRGAEPISEVRAFKAPAQVRRHYDRVRLPEGFAVVGDAACALDPVFGQGMSVAAITARALHAYLRRSPFSSRVVSRLVAQSADRPWMLTSVEALRYAQAGHRAGIGVMHAFLDRVGVACARDPVVYRAFLDVLHLHRPAAHLFRPDLLFRILRPRGRPHRVALPPVFTPKVTAQLPEG